MKKTIRTIAVMSCALSLSQAQALPPPPVSPAPVTNYEFDAAGNPTKRIAAPGTPGFGFATSSSYDALGRRQSIRDARNGLVQLNHDGRDNIVKVTDPRGLVTHYPRNGLGEATQVVSPDAGTSNQAFDAAGNLLTRTDSRGVVANYFYDALQRLKEIRYVQPGVPSFSEYFNYDEQTNAAGKLTSVVTQQYNRPTFLPNNTKYFYDQKGRVVETWQTMQTGITISAKFVTSYTYDAADNITQVIYPSGRVVTVTHRDGYPVAIGIAKNRNSVAQPLLSQIEVEPDGPPQSWLWHMKNGSTVAHRREFDLSGRMVRYPLGKMVRDLTFDAADRIVSYTHLDAVAGTATPAASALNQAFQYDELGRLTGIAMTGSTWSIGYDANGNRTGVTLNGVTRPYTIAATSNRLLGIGNPSRGFSHDSAGNTVQDTNPDAPYTATYGPDNRLAQLTRGSTSAIYEYNVWGQRLRKQITSAGVTTVRYFTYDFEGQLVGEYEYFPDTRIKRVLREYVWLRGVPVAMFTSDPEGSTGPAYSTEPNSPATEPIVYFIHADHIDTPRVVVDRDDRIRWRWLAEPFGVTAAEENPSGLGAFVLNLRFDGQYFDQESGLHYNHWRYFDPRTGRYITPDPLVLDGGDLSRLY